MASQKILGGDHTMQILFNEDSEDDLITESNSNQSSDSERPKSPETAIISDVSDVICGIVTNNNLEYVCEQINLYASQIIGATPHPFTKHPLFRTWTPVTVATLKIFLGLMFVSRPIHKPILKICWTEDPVFEIPIF
jgi:hypothetical protein